MSKLIKEPLQHLKLHIDSLTQIVRDFKILHSPLHRPCRETKQRNAGADTINQKSLIDIYKTFPPNQNDIPYSQHLMKLSPKLTTYSVTKQSAADRRKWKQHPASYLFTTD